MTQIIETIGRSAILAAASNYQSVAEAVMELVDNAFDKRYGRHLTICINVNKSRDHLEVLDCGGEGMNAAGLQEWIRWGEGPEHHAQDIGQYRIGGKLAAVYLAEELEVVSRKSGEQEAWKFHDPHWGSRTDALTSSQIAEVDISSMRWPARAPQEGEGFTRVTLRGLKDHRYEVSILKQRLATTYRALIHGNACKIVVDKDAVTPFEIPWSSSVEVREVVRTQVHKGVYVQGRVGAIDRDRLPEARGVRLKAGIRTEFNGRMITEGEEFGHNLAGKGNLQRTYGEIAISGDGLKPNQLKNGWPYDNIAWKALADCIHDEMQPVVTALARISEGQQVSRDERKRANNASRRVADALRRLRSSIQHGVASPSGLTDNVAPGGRRSPMPRENDRTAPGSETNETRKRRHVQNPTPPPEDPVGRLLRRAETMPKVDFERLGDQTPRTQKRDEDDGTQTIVVNVDYPLYQSMGGMEDYVFESLVSHFVQQEAVSTAEANTLFDQIIWLDKEGGR